jgi:hypothetical protein
MAKIHTEVISCELCGKPTKTVAGRSKSEIDKLKLIYSICIECMNDPIKLAQWKKSKEK